MTEKQFSKLITSLLLLPPFIFVFLVVGKPIWLFHWSDFRKGNEIVRRAEAFRAKHNGALPATLEELGIQDEDYGVFYRKANERDYIVWFGLSLGESETYDSVTKKWD